MTTMTDEHPTHGEWVARQAALPSTALAILRDVAAVRAAEAEADRLRRAQWLAADREHRDDFEAAVAAALEANGGAWLAAHRVPDHQVKGLPTFDRHTGTYSAMFDATALGCWPIILRLDYRRDRWMVQDQLNPWIAWRPDAAPGFQDFANALAFACEHARTPF